MTELKKTKTKNKTKKQTKNKHLRITLSSKYKLTKRIDSIINSDSKQILYPQKLKFQLPKRTLGKRYCTYTGIYAPFIRYASVVWDGCELSDINR